MPSLLPFQCSNLDTTLGSIVVVNLVVGAFSSTAAAHDCLAKVQFCESLLPYWMLSHSYPRVADSSSSSLRHRHSVGSSGSGRVVIDGLVSYPLNPTY
jgi:hypothetical protein